MSRLLIHLTAETTELVLDYPLGSPGGIGRRVQIDAERMVVSSGLGTRRLVVERGADDTVPAPHVRDATVTLIQTVTGAVLVEGSTWQVPGAGNHPNGAAHVALGLAASHGHDYASPSHGHTHSHTDVTDHVAVADPHVAYALDADLATHNHDASYSGTGHSHPGGSHPDLTQHEALGLSTSHAHPYSVTSHNHDASYSGTGHTHQAFPVGSVFLSVVTTDPATLLGYGTWARIAQGRMLIGQDVAAAFDTAEETGGALTHGHTSTQPSDHAALTHSGATVGNHAVTQPSAHADHTLSGAIAGEAAHTHGYSQTVNHVHPLATGTGATGNFAQVIGTVDTSAGGTGATPTQTALGTLSGNPSGGVASGTTAAGASHTHGNGTLAVSAHAAHSGAAVDAHTVGQASQHAAQSHSGASVADGSSLPPYFVVFAWKRTA